MNLISIHALQQVRPLNFSWLA